jgi:glycosyltransferase involved in cell wall biosynthesis
MPSVEREGLSKALLEAMSLGITPIVTRVGGMPEVVIHEQNGLVVPPRSSEELAAAILRLYKNEEERRSFARNAKNTIYERFNVDGTTRETMALYRRLVSC